MVGNRPGLGVHVHPVVGGVKTHLAKGHVHTPPRPRVVGGGHGTPGQGARAHPVSASSCRGGVTTHLAKVHMHLASVSSCGGGVTTHLARVRVHTPPRPRVVGGGRARRGVPRSRCAKSEVCHGRIVRAEVCMVVSCAPRCAMVEVCQVEVCHGCVVRAEVSHVLGGRWPMCLGRSFPCAW